MNLYLAVTPDKYELPIAVRDNPTDLGNIFGVTRTTVSTSIHKNSPGKRSGVKFIRVEVDDEDYQQ